MENSDKERILHGPVPLVPIVQGTAGQQLFDALKRYEHFSTAVVCPETHTSFSYKQLLDHSCQLAYTLQKHGLGLGSTVSIFSENSIYFFYALLASLYVGITVAPLSFDYVGDELYHAVNISKPQLLFCSKKTLKKALPLQKNIRFLKKLVVLDLNRSTQEVECLNDFMVSNIDCKNFKPLYFDPCEHVAFVLCSSGTTGLPKGVMITHTNLSVRFAQMKDPVLGLSSKPGTTVLSILPMTHIGGLGLALMYLILGFRNITMKRFSSELFLRLIEKYRVETSFVAPPVMSILAKAPCIKEFDLSSLRDICCGAAPLSKEIIFDVLKKLPHLKEVRQGYGLTETTLTTTFSPRGDAIVGSSGKLYPFTSAKVIDFNTGEALGPYQNGELCFKGGLIMKGYIGKSSSAEDVIDDEGWLHTGDMGYYDTNQHFYIVDRIKELIKYKAYQVSPTELEALLLRHPKIKDVAVIGIDDAYAGQLPRAYVVKQPNEDLCEQDIVKYVIGQVSNQKQLRGGVVFIDEIPRIASGKIARKYLRELSQRQSSKL